MSLPFLSQSQFILRIKLRKVFIHRLFYECKQYNPNPHFIPVDHDNDDSTEPIQTNTISTEIGVRLACHIIADDFTVFDLHDIEKEEGEDPYTTGHDGNDLRWSFCNYLPGK